MTELTFRGVHSDGEHLQLSDAAGNDYLLPIDESLYAAIRAQRLHAAQQDRDSGQQVRPRDIQAMIRSGMTAAEVAEETGESLEHIKRYEHPVLAERAHIARQARDTLVYPDSSADGSPTPLIRLCEERLTMRDVDLETMDWDAWKQNSGSWYVELRFVAADRERRAGWEYSRGTMLPLDDEARWLADSGPTDSGPIPNFGSGDERAYNAAHQDGERGTASPLRDHQAETGRILESLRRRRGRHSAEPEARETNLSGPGSDPVAAAGDAPLQPAPKSTTRGRLHAVAEEPAPHPDGAHTALSAPAEASDDGRLPVPGQQTGPADTGSSPAGSRSAPSPASSAGRSPAGQSSSVGQATTSGQSTFDIFDDQPSLLDEPGVHPGADDDSAAGADRNSTQPVPSSAGSAGSQQSAAPGSAPNSGGASRPASAPAGSPTSTAPAGATSAAPPAPASSADTGSEEPKKKNGRSSVPSWDEIMFGTKRD